MHITGKKNLEETIIELEKRKIAQHNSLMDQLHITTESLKPKNLIKGAFSRVVHSPDARASLIKTIAGVGIGMLTKKLFIGKSTSLVKKVLGNAVRFGVTKTAINNTGRVRAYGTAIYNNLFRKNANHKKVM